AEDAPADGTLSGVLLHGSGPRACGWASVGNTRSRQLIVRIRDVIIVGAGPAGLSAAQKLRRLGVADILVLERESAAGGAPRHCGHLSFGVFEFHRLMSGPTFAKRLIAATQGIEVRTSTTVTQLQPAGVIKVTSASGEHELAARSVLLAMGARETPRSARL